MRARHQRNVLPGPGLPFAPGAGAVTKGSPGTFHPPTHASNSPNGLSGVEPPRRGESAFARIMIASLELSHHAPASSMTTFAPACVSAWAAMPPPAPDPTIATSYTV